MVGQYSQVKIMYEHVVAVYATNTIFNADAIPSALTELPNWVIWSLIKTTKSKPDDKPSKRPIRITKSNKHHPKIDVARWSKPEHLYSFDDALQLYNDNPGVVSGLGFIPTPSSGIVVIDYDNYLPQSANDPRNKYVKSLTETTFVETSQSGKGLHAFLFGKLDNRHNDSAGSGVEIYPGKRKSFIAMTGNTYLDAPSILDTNQTIIDEHIEEFFKTSSSSSNSYSGYTIPDHIPNGNRNNELTRLCGYLFHVYGDIQKVAAEMYKFNQTLCETPLSTDELGAIISSIASRDSSQFAHLLEQIYHVKSTNTWFDFSDMTEMTANALDITHIKEFPGRKNTKPLVTKWLARQPDFRQAVDFTWAPLPYGQKQRTLIMESRIYINTWKGFNLEPVPGNVTPWLTHLAHVIPEEDYRAALLWWLAYTLQNPDKKINWQPIVLGISGAGKDALFRPIAKILGSAYKTIGNKDIKGDYDDGLYQTKLLHISEANGLSGKAVEYYKRITATEADDMFILNVKSKAKVIQRNICNVVAITNNLDAFKFDNSERRAFVLRSPNIMSESAQQAYFDDWFDVNGSAYLFDYLLKHDLSHFKPGVRPYKTTHFDAMYDITRSDDEIGIADAVENYEAMSVELIRLMHESDGRYTASHIKTWLESNGWVRWDGGSLSRRICKYHEGRQQTKSRSWYVKKDGKFFESSSSTMFDECERLEKIISQKKKY